MRVTNATALSGTFGHLINKSPKDFFCGSVQGRPLRETCSNQERRFARTVNSMRGLYRRAPAPISEDIAHLQGAKALDFEGDTEESSTDPCPRTKDTKREPSGTRPLLGFNGSDIGQP